MTLTHRFSTHQEDAVKEKVGCDVKPEYIDMANQVVVQVSVIVLVNGYLYSNNRGICPSLCLIQLHNLLSGKLLH
jgi:hypothetical protein